MILYGIPNCDTCRKARRWLSDAGIAHDFHDLRKDGLEADQLKSWLDEIGADTLINRRGTTWRQLSDVEKQQADDENQAIELLLSHPTLIKRPVLAHGTGVSVGFSPAQYETLLAGAD